MNREKYEEMVQREIEKALEKLFPSHVGITLEQRLKLSYAIRNAIRATESLTRDYYLTNLRTADDLGGGVRRQWSANARYCPESA